MAVVDMTTNSNRWQEFIGQRVVVKGEYEGTAYERVGILQSIDEDGDPVVIEDTFDDDDGTAWFGTHWCGLETERWWT